jgi:hypothetical protein
MPVSISTEQYYFSTGKQPKGTGPWAFCPSEKFHSKNYLDFIIWTPSLTYSAAKKFALAEAKKRGITTSLQVCP